MSSHFKIRVAEPNIEEEDAKAMYQAVKENRLSSGKYVEEFENEFAKYVGVKELEDMAKEEKQLMMIMELGALVDFKNYLI